MSEQRADLPPDRLTALWQRIKHHRIAQWTVGYVALAYGIQHAVILTSESFQWPNIVARVSMLLLALGLPVAITLAWYHGERTARGFSRGEFSILAALLAGVSILFYAFVQPAAERTTASASTAQEAGVTAARTAAANPRLGIAVAVMPFANLSGDKEQEYFSDGMTDEISGALAKIPDLSVVARSSAYEFKGKNQNARALGQQLHATHLIEGSVRKAGDQLRISAQLVKADDGVTIWSSSYDRQLKDVFAVQEDIARAVATSLHMTLGLKPGEELVNHRQIDPALHDQYLRAKNLVRSRRPDSIDEGIKLLNDVVARDPGYAPGWAALAFAYQGAVLINNPAIFGDTEQAKPLVQGLMKKIEAAAQQAIKLDPNTAEALCALAITQASRNDHIAAMELRQRALAIDPDSPECLQSAELGSLGFIKQALPVRDHLLALEPFVPAYRNVTARILFTDGQDEAAIAMLKSIPGGAGGQALLAQIYAAQGRYREAADNVASLNARTPAASKAIATAARLLRAAPAPAPQNDRPDLGILNWVYLYTGAPEHFMDIYENALRLGSSSNLSHPLEWAPAYHNIRQTERFKKWVRDAGILTYWRAKGWPPQCHPITAPARAEAPGAKADADFTCD